MGTMFKLANCYGKFHRYDDELKFLEELQALQKAAFDPEDPDKCRFMVSLAACYGNLNRYAEAIKINKETLPLLKAKLGSDHPYTILNIANLATCYFHCGQFDDALELSQEAVKLSMAKLGPKHSDTLTNMEKVAYCYSCLKRYAEAFKLYEETLKLMRASLPPDHPKAIQLMNNLAYDLANCADLEFRNPTRAVELAKEVVALTPNNGDNWNTLGLTLYRSGDWKAAISALEKSMQFRKGGDSNDWFVLALAHWQLGEKQEALKWYDRAVQWVDKNMPKDQDLELQRIREEATDLL